MIVVNSSIVLVIMKIMLLSIVLQIVNSVDVVIWFVNSYLDMVFGLDDCYCLIICWIKVVISIVVVVQLSMLGCMVVFGVWVFYVSVWLGNVV